MQLDSVTPRSSPQLIPNHAQVHITAKFVLDSEQILRGPSDLSWVVTLLDIDASLDDVAVWRTDGFEVLRHHAVGLGTVLDLAYPIDRHDAVPPPEPVAALEVDVREGVPHLLCQPKDIALDAIAPGDGPRRHLGSAKLRWLDRGQCTVESQRVYAGSVS